MSFTRVLPFSPCQWNRDLSGLELGVSFPSGQPVSGYVASPMWADFKAECSITDHLPSSLPEARTFLQDSRWCQVVLLEMRLRRVWGPTSLDPWVFCCSLGYTEAAGIATCDAGSPTVMLIPRGWLPWVSAPASWFGFWFLLLSSLNALSLAPAGGACSCDSTPLANWAVDRSSLQLARQTHSL